jgi:hypothetical protein
MPYRRSNDDFVYIKSNFVLGLIEVYVSLINNTKDTIWQSESDQVQQQSIVHNVVFGVVKGKFKEAR